MKLIIDAQLICGFFREDRGGDPLSTASMKPIIDDLGRTDIGYVDEDGHLEQEYRQAVDPEWFDAWFFDRMIAGDFVSVRPSKFPQLIKKLVNDFGFPQRGCDRRYVVLAKTLVDREGSNVVLLSEDLDFYSPRDKRAGGRRRDHLLRSHGGSVAKYLRKHEGVLVRSVVGHQEAHAA